MRLTVVGCSGSYPGPDSPASCYLLEAPYGDGSFRLVLDLGSGSLGYLQRHLALEDVDAVALTHLHPDHCLDLCGFYVVRKYHPGGPWSRLPVYGPAGTPERLARGYDLAPGQTMDGEFDFHTYPDHEFSVGPFTISVAPVNHPVAAYALRISDGRSTMVYSGDTGPCAAFDELVKGCDLLLSEASFIEADDNPPDLHLSGRQAAQTADAAGAGMLVLTHIPPWHSAQEVLAEAEPHFRGTTRLATPGATFDL